MHTHIKIVAWLNILRGAIGLLAAAAVLLGGIFGGLLGGLFADGGFLSWLAVGVVGVVGSILMAALALIWVVAGFALLNHRSWARYLLIVASLFGLFNWPIGTLLSGYSLWVLLNGETRQIFDSAP